jgi:hypothetical protein
VIPLNLPQPIVAAHIRVSKNPFHRTLLYRIWHRAKGFRSEAASAVWNNLPSNKIGVKYSLQNYVSAPEELGGPPRRLISLRAVMTKPTS